MFCVKIKITTPSIKIPESFRELDLCLKKMVIVNGIMNHHVRMYKTDLLNTFMNE